MKCSHGLPYESKCSMCFEEAMKYVRTQAPIPDAKAPQEVRDAFWLSAYRQGQGVTVVDEKR